MGNGPPQAEKKARRRRKNPARDDPAFFCVAVHVTAPFQKKGGMPTPKPFHMLRLESFACFLLWFSLMDRVMCVTKHAHARTPCERCIPR